MGMAASQLRLLSITARQHDVEFEAQQIQAAKLALANQSDSVYEKYIEALDATTMTVKTIDNAGQTSTICATYNNLCSKDRVSLPSDKQYALLNASNGYVIVDEDVAQTYPKFQFQDAQTFALYMVTGKTNLDVEQFNSSVENAKKEVYSNNRILQSNRMSNLENSILDLLGSLGSNPTSIYSDEVFSVLDEPNEEKYEEYKNLLYQYETQLFNNFGDQVYSNVTGEKAEKFNENLYNYYVGIFKQIQACGGCESIHNYDEGLNTSDVANNTDWLQANIQNGRFVLSSVSTNRITHDITMETTTADSGAIVGYTNTTSIDKNALAKAEAEYEYELKKINKKDKQYDLELSKLETERKALTTEYEATKQVCQDNIDRTFKLFS